ncbi:PREDICTED: protein BFR2-like [Nicotiana attenuata]|uniref:protein BFR2-like n=1 Tax=Nicotiana attenuata TaxID=49451 RepID=UPI000904F805|nr:PREDICTED: protein BFR2-like [Nicotiana attenuata]
MHKFKWKNRFPKTIVEEEKDSDDGALGGEDDENSDDVAQEVDKNAEEEEEAEEDDKEDDNEDDEHLEDGEHGLKSETHATVGVGDKPIHFGLKKFAMMTGLNCGAKPSKEEMNKVMDDGETFCDKVCQSSRKGVEAEMLLKQLKSEMFHTEERFKIALVWFVHSVLLARDNIAHVDKKWICIADNLEVFIKYPWSKECFELTIEYLKKDMFPIYKSYMSRSKENKISGKKSKSASYALYGFPWAFMIRRESILLFGRSAEKSNVVPMLMPRMLRWHIKKVKSDSDWDTYK